jgi:hypothetical protein
MHEGKYTTFLSDDLLFSLIFIDLAPDGMKGFHAGMRFPDNLRMPPDTPFITFDPSNK